MKNNLEHNLWCKKNRKMRNIKIRTFEEWKKKAKLKLFEQMVISDVRSAEEAECQLIRLSNSWIKTGVTMSSTRLVYCAFTNIETKSNFEQFCILA